MGVMNCKITHFTPSYSYSVMTHAWLVTFVILCKYCKIQDFCFFFVFPSTFLGKNEWMTCVSIQVRGNSEKGKRNMTETKKS